MTFCGQCWVGSPPGEMARDFGWGYLNYIIYSEPFALESAQIHLMNVLGNMKDMEKFNYKYENC